MTVVERYQAPPTHGELDQLRDQAKVVAATQMVPKAFRNRPDEIVAAALFGRECGFSLMTSLQYIDVIDGSPGVNAEGCVALVRANGHSISGQIHPDGKGATATGRRCDTGDTMTFTWTLAMAERAGLATKDVWRKYPESMCWARAVDQLCRMLFSDVVSGIASTQSRPIDLPPSNRAMLDSAPGEIVTLPEDQPLDGPFDDADIVDDTPFSLEVFKRRANSLSGEWRAHLRKALTDAGCDRTISDLTEAEQRRAMAVLAAVEQEAHATYERRRKHTLAVCSELGLDDDERHALIRYATEGATDSSRVLSERQLEQVIECVERVKADTLMLEHDADGNPMWWPNRPINPQPVNEYGEELY